MQAQSCAARFIAHGSHANREGIRNKRFRAELRPACFRHLYGTVCIGVKQTPSELRAAHVSQTHLHRKNEAEARYTRGPAGVQPTIGNRRTRVYLYRQRDGFKALYCARPSKSEHSVKAILSCIILRKYIVMDSVDKIAGTGEAKSRMAG